MARAVCCGLALTILVATGGTILAADRGKHLQELVAGLPDEVAGWRRAEPEFYGPDDLYRYINGGAELYIAFQFTAAVSQPYVDETDEEIRLDIFDMGSPASAFGVFAHSRETVDRFVAPEVESEYAGGLLHFWKDRYYGSTLGYPATEARKHLIRELARSIAARIDGDCRPPDLVALLPAAELLPGSVRYFRHPAWINDYHHFAAENLLNIGADTEVAMARIRPATAEARPPVLVVVRYPAPDEAATAARQFTGALLADAENALGQDDTGAWLGCLQRDDLVIVVADARDPETAARLLETCARPGDHDRRGDRDDE